MTALNKWAPVLPQGDVVITFMLAAIYLCVGCVVRGVWLGLPNSWQHRVSDVFISLVCDAFACHWVQNPRSASYYLPISTKPEQSKTSMDGLHKQVLGEHAPTSRSFSKRKPSLYRVHTNGHESMNSSSSVWCKDTLFEYLFKTTIVTR